MKVFIDVNDLYNLSSIKKYIRIISKITDTQIGLQNIYFLSTNDFCYYTKRQYTTDTLVYIYSIFEMDIFVDIQFIFFCFLKSEKQENFFFKNFNFKTKILAHIIHAYAHVQGFVHNTYEQREKMFEYEKKISILLQNTFKNDL